MSQIMARRFRLFLPALGLALLVGSPSWADQVPQRLGIDYRFYVGGLDLFAMDVAAELAPTRYSLDTRMRTQGLADTLVSSTILSKVDGAIARGKAVPQRYSSVTEGRFGPRSIEMTYGADGPTDVKVAPPDAEDDRTPVTDDLKRGTVDPLTASLMSAIAQSTISQGRLAPLVAAGTASESGAAGAAPVTCPGTVPVFDGRRRYDIQFTYEGEDTLATSHEAAYAGPAIICRMDTRRIAGFSRKWEREEDRDKPPPPKLWLARLGPEGIVLPVRLVAKTRWGTAIAHLQRLTADGRPVLEAPGG
jgi:hypothetical protein